MRMKHVLMIGQQVLYRIRDLHSLDFVHGDIKPLNLVFGREKYKNVLTLIDFGLTQKESSFPDNLYNSTIYEKENLMLRGTPNYASINLHLGWNKIFKKDDLESFFYLLIFLSKGRLPWADLPKDGRDNYQKILKAKIKATTEDLCENLPDSFRKLHNYITTLNLLDKIDYNFIEDLLREAADQSGFKLQVNSQHFSLYNF